LVQGLSATPSVIAVVSKFIGDRIIVTKQSRAVATWVLNDTGTAALFNEVISLQDEGAADSKIETIATLARQRGVGLEAVAWIEDFTPEVEAARRAGVFVMVVERPYNRALQLSADVVLPAR
jgi:beta-phosphoglucomutase-like phosphatase (HAD superfamily)